MLSNKLQNAILIIGLTALIACGQSKEEQAAAEKHKMDSIANASAQNAKAELLKQQAMQDSINEAKMIEETNLETNKMRLIELKGELAGAKSKMQDIQSFQLGRSHADKDIQIAEQTKVIEQLKVQIEELENEISK
jgi:hypothetical protein